MSMKRFSVFSLQSSELRTQDSRPRTRKGQSVVFEQVLLFSVGVALFVFLFAVFSGLRGIWNTQAANDKLDAVTDQIAGTIVQVAGDPGQDSLHTVLIPKTVAGESYKVELDANGIVIRLETGPYHIVKDSALFSLPQAYTFAPSTAWSVRGKLTVKKSGSTISIV